MLIGIVDPAGNDRQRALLVAVDKGADAEFGSEMRRQRLQDIEAEIEMIKAACGDELIDRQQHPAGEPRPAGSGQACCQNGCGLPEITGKRGKQRVADQGRALHQLQRSEAVGCQHHEAVSVEDLRVAGNAIGHIANQCLMVSNIALMIEEGTGGPFRVHSLHPMGKVSARKIA